MINALWIPPANPLTVARLAIWFLLGNICFTEAWEDLSTWNTYERQFAPVEARYRWLGFGIISLESAISFKFVKDAGNLVLEPEHPWIVVGLWAIAIFACFAFYLKLRFKKDRTVKFL